VTLTRICSSSVTEPPFVWPETEIHNVDIRREVAEALTTGADKVETSKWPAVLAKVGTQAEIDAWCGEQLAQLPVSRVISGGLADLSRQSTRLKRLQRVDVEVKQTVAIGLDYQWNDKTYAHWELALLPVDLNNHTPLYDRAVELCQESVDLWNAGQKDEAILKARFCLDIAKKYNKFAGFLEKAKIADELRSSAKSQAWKIFGAATTKRVVDGTTAAVKAVTGWVGGFFSSKKQ
jgi:hypothetical protein